MNFERMFWTITKVLDHWWTCIQQFFRYCYNTKHSCISGKHCCERRCDERKALTWSFLFQWRSHHLLTFVIFLTKTTLPFLMLLSLSMWSFELPKSNLCTWMCHKWFLSLALLIWLWLHHPTLPSLIGSQCMFLGVDVGGWTNYN